MKEKIGNALGIAYWVLWGIGSIIFGSVICAGAIALGIEKISGETSDTDQ